MQDELYCAELFDMADEDGSGDLELDEIFALGELIDRKMAGDMGLDSLEDEVNCAHARAGMPPPLRACTTSHSVRAFVRAFRPRPMPGKGEGIRGWRVPNAFLDHARPRVRCGPDARSHQKVC